MKPCKGSVGDSGASNDTVLISLRVNNRTPCCNYVTFNTDSPRANGLLLAGLVGSKIVQEWVLHGAQIMDRYNLDDVLHRLFR